MVYTTFRFSCLSKQGSRLGETLIFKKKRPPFEGSVACLPGSENRNESKTSVFYTFQLNHTQRTPTQRRALQRACYHVFVGLVFYGTVEKRQNNYPHHILSYIHTFYRFQRINHIPLTVRIEGMGIYPLYTGFEGLSAIFLTFLWWLQVAIDAISPQLASRAWPDSSQIVRPTSRRCLGRNSDDRTRKACENRLCVMSPEAGSTSSFVS